MKQTVLLMPCLFLAASSAAFGDVTARQVALTAAPLAANTVELKNDGYNPAGGQAILEQGFAVNEKAGVWVQVPNDVTVLKIDSFRVLMGDGSANAGGTVQVFFDMTVAAAPALAIGGQITNAANITSGPYWNDIPAQGQASVLPCAKAGEYVGASVEFTQAGVPSVFRDNGPITNPALNLIFAVPGGWSYSSSLGVTGNWILRVIGHPAQAGEC